MSKDSKEVQRTGAGRPSNYDEDKMLQIFDKIAVTDMSIEAILAEMGGSVKPSTFWLYMSKHPELLEKYARAREFRAELFADKLYALVFAPLPAMDMAAVQQLRIQVDALKWMMSKWLPKVYGEKKSVDVETSGTVDVNVNHKLDKGQYEDYKNAMLAKVRETKFIQLPKEDIEDADYEDA